MPSFSFLYLLLLESPARNCNHNLRASHRLASSIFIWIIHEVILYRVGIDTVLGTSLPFEPLIQRNYVCFIINLASFGSEVLNVPAFPHSNILLIVIVVLQCRLYHAEGKRPIYPEGNLRGGVQGPIKIRKPSGRLGIRLSLIDDG